MWSSVLPERVWAGAESSARRDGYFLARGALEAELIADVRTDVQAAAYRHGWLAAPDALATECRDLRLAHDDPSLCALHASVLASRAFARLRDASRLRDLLAVVTGRSVEPIGAGVCRITFPGEPGGTPAHQDASYLQRSDFWTAWIPLAPCPRDRGPLEVAVRSHTLGLLPHDGEAGLAGDHQLDWRPVPCEEGDVLLFHAHSAHRGGVNRSAGLVRLSLDIRYAPV